MSALNRRAARRLAKAIAVPDIASCTSQTDTHQGTSQNKLLHIFLLLHTFLLRVPKSQNGASNWACLESSPWSDKILTLFSLEEHGTCRILTCLGLTQANPTRNHTTMRLQVPLITLGLMMQEATIIHISITKFQ